MKYKIDLYGKSPGVEALEILKEYNALPEEERARASVAFAVEIIQRDMILGEP